MKTVQPVDMANEARIFIQNNTVTRISVQKKTLQFVYKSMEEEFENTDSLERVLEVMEMAKDIGFKALVERIIDFMEETSDRKKVYHEYKMGLISDHSGASDQDNR